MPHARNIRLNIMKQNGNNMTVKNSIPRDQYDAQFQSEQRYAVASLPEVKEDHFSSMNHDMFEFLNEHFDLEESEMSLLFRDFIREHSPSIAEKISAIWKENRASEWSKKNSNFQTWDEVKNWDRLIKCPNTSCDERVSKTSASNDFQLWAKLIQILNPLFDNDSEEIDKVITQHHLSSGRRINFEQCREIFGDKFELNEQLNLTSIEPFNEGELFHTFNKNRDVYQAMIYLNYCSKKTTCCEKCGEDLWTFTPGLKNTEDDLEYFTQISETALRALVSCLLGSEHSSSIKSFLGRIQDFILPSQKDNFDYTQYSDDPNSLIRDIRQGKHDEGLDSIIQYEKKKDKKDKNVIKAAQSRKKGEIRFQPGLVGENNFEMGRHRASISEALSACFAFGEKNLTLPDGQSITFKDSENDPGHSLSVLSMVAINKMAAELVKFKPLIFFSDDKEGYPSNKQLRWAKKLAAQILLVIIDIDSIIHVNKVTPDHLNIDAKKYEHSMWMIQFKSNFRKQLFEKFAHLNGDDNPTDQQIVVRYFDTDRVDPMYVPPLDRTRDQLEGGYLTKNAQMKNPLIRNNASESLFNIKRFEPSQIAIDNLNQLQKTNWKINKSIAHFAVKLLKTQIDTFASKLKITKSDYGYKIDYNGKFPDFSKSQIDEWKESLYLAEEIVGKGYGIWHAWCFDWRGRMYTCSNLLSPQGDDLSRGMLEFGAGIPLDSTGWKWMRRAIGRFYTKIQIDSSSSFTHSEFKVWEEIQTMLRDKTWNGIDNVFSNKNMHDLLFRVLKEVAKDPISTFPIWGEGDIFRKKAEGFQRLAMTFAYVDAFEEFENGNETPLVSIPIVLDASSNIYQHASCLTQDVEMAKAVNVLPNVNKTPSDIYQEIADEVSRMWGKENPLTSLGLDDTEMKEVMKFALKRNTAKKPVMTIGYGSEKYAIVPTFLTHNQQAGGIHEWGTFRLDDKSELTLKQKSQLKEDYPDKKERDKIAKARMIAHPNSILGQLAKSISRSNHYHIANKIVESFIEAIDKKLNGHSTLRNSLEQIRILSKLSSEETNYVSWKLNDGSVIRNIVFEKMLDDPTTPWKGIEMETEIRFSIKLHSEKRSDSKESSGLPPNFVHSIDACHMRSFVQKFNAETNCDMIWSVHDAFGSHPNYIDTLSRVAVETFFETHKTSEGISHLHILLKKALTLPPPNEEEMVKKFKLNRLKLETTGKEFASNPCSVEMETLNESHFDDIYLIS
jgi:hypothetical protein